MKDEVSPCLNGRARQDGSQQTVIAVLTPDRPEKRQNGRRFKADGEPMFTLTGQDKHGVMIIDPQGRKNKDCVPKDHCPTLRSESHGNQPCVVNHKHIRRLTPLECFRLQFGMKNAAEMIAKAKELNISDTQLYKMAGNAVSSLVVQCIAERLVKPEDFIEVQS